MILVWRQQYLGLNVSEEVTTREGWNSMSTIDGGSLKLSYQEENNCKARKQYPIRYFTSLIIDVVLRNRISTKKFEK